MLSWMNQEDFRDTYWIHWAHKRDFYLLLSVEALFNYGNSRSNQNQIKSNQESGEAL